MTSSISLVSMLHIFSVIFIVVNGYPHFPDRIPNGRNIAHPCIDKFMWYALGHENYKGGGVRNPFGLDFAKYGYEWNTCFCESDSDGDGRTNGEELGDPLCEWKVGDEPMRTTALSHPGICEPMNSALCQDKNAWVDCSAMNDQPCLGVDDPNTEKIDLNYPKTNVPNRETTYICKAFNLTEYMNAGDYHLIATRGSIDNTYVMHHILVYACADEYGDQVMANYSDPQVCGMATRLCPNIIAMWTVGFEWFCSNNQSGIAVGTNGYKYVLMQHHWNNPELRSDYTDASGIELYITRDKRPYDSGVVFIGPAFLQIPPGWQRWEVPGGCSSDCWNRMITEPIYITHIMPHMHYLGSAFEFEIWRNGNMIHQYTLDRYNYDNPEYAQYAEAIEVQPGDEMKLVCIFQSKNRDYYTYFGEATSDEMCYAILMYYPFRTSVTDCKTTNGYGKCAASSARALVNTAECSFSDLMQVSETYGQAVVDTCDRTGLECYDACRPVAEQFTTHPCFNGEAAQHVRGLFTSVLMKSGLTALSSCDPKPPPMVGDLADGGVNSQCDGQLVPSPSAAVNSAACMSFMITCLLIMILPAVFK